MTNDPLDTALQHSGTEPTAAFTSGLESLLSRAYDGEPIATSTPLAAARPARRWIASVAAVAVIAAAVVAAVVVRNDRGDNVVTTPEPATTPPLNTQPSPSTSIAPSPTTDADTTLPGTTQPTTTTTAATTTTIASVAPTEVTVDLTTAATPLQPTIVASIPSAPAGDLFPTSFAVPAGDDRIAVLDDVTGVVRFIDAATGDELASYATPIPTIGSNSYVIGVFVGPDDVIYVNVGNADGSSLVPGPTLIAYARSGGAYVEVARKQHSIGDIGNLSLGPVGISVPGLMNDTTVMPYVDETGQPSGVVLDIDDITFGPDAIERGDLSWIVSYTMPDDVGFADGCPLCRSVYYGPKDSVVLVHPAPKPDGDIQNRVTVLSDTVVSYDTDWTYVGVLGDTMLFTHLDQDSIDIGTVAI